jgi:branched-subunit amino acid permease
MLCEEAIVKERKKHQHGIISWTEFTEMALKVGIPMLAIPRAASFLHEVGVMLWFEEKNSGNYPKIFRCIDICQD